MPSGGITITPGYQLAPGEKINNAKLNQGFQPVGQVDEGAITDRELDPDIVDSIGNTEELTAKITGKNLLCNGNFDNWATADYLTFGATFGSGVSGSGFKHTYAAAPASGTETRGPDRWVTPNSVGRAFQRGDFGGPDVVPDNPTHYLRLTQNPAFSGVNPAYLGQRLEGVLPFNQRVFTFSIWARADPGQTFPVKPACRLYFGSTGTAEIVLPGTPVTLLPGTWAHITQTFTIPDITGFTISGTPPFNYPFTEFRIELPQATIFAIDFAHASVVAGDKLLAWDQRLPHEDLLYAWRYFQILGFNLVTAARFADSPPFANLRASMLKPDVYRIKTLVPFTGTGASVGVATIFPDAIYQTNAHSAQSTAYVIIDGELYDP